MSRISLLALCVLMMAAPAVAGEAVLPIRVVILDCRTVKAAGRECMYKGRCCAVYERKKKEQGRDG